MAKLTYREIPIQIVILICTAISVILIGTVGFVIAGDMQISKAFIFTLEALAFRAHAEGSAAMIALDTILKLFGAILIWIAVWTAFDIAIEGKLGTYIKEAKMISEIQKLKNHYIVCGAGRVGRFAGERLKQRNENIVFIEKDKEVIDRLVKAGHLIMEAGPVDESVLLEAGIKKAKGLIAALGDDSKNLMLVISARDLNPRIKIASRVHDIKHVSKFKKAGADLIIIPETTGGIKLADALLGNLSPDVITGS